MMGGGGQLLWLYLDADSCPDEVKQKFSIPSKYTYSIYKLLFRSFSGISNYTIGVADWSSNSPDYYDFYIFEPYFNSAGYCDFRMVIYMEEDGVVYEYSNYTPFTYMLHMGDSPHDYHNFTIYFDKLGKTVNYKAIKEAYIAFYDVG